MNTFSAPTTGTIPPYSSAGHCFIHGAYFGYSCPGCNAAPQPPLDPTLPTLVRIALALERIAAALEAQALNTGDPVASKP